MEFSSTQLSSYIKSSTLVLSKETFELVEFKSPRVSAFIPNLNNYDSEELINLEKCLER